MQPLASLTSPKVKFRQNQEGNTSFDNAKEILAHDTLLVCRDFDNPFHLDTDASKNQLGVIIYQDHDIIAYHSLRLNKHQENYYAPEKEDLSIVDMLKHFPQPY